jgi:hypothetical protein
VKFNRAGINDDQNQGEMYAEVKEKRKFLHFLFLRTRQTMRSIMILVHSTDPCEI